MFSVIHFLPVHKDTSMKLLSIRRVIKLIDVSVMIRMLYYNFIAFDVNKRKFLFVIRILYYLYFIICILFI